MSSHSQDWLVPPWPAPGCIKAFCTTRHGGFSTHPYDTLNLGSHVGDDIAVVEKNRETLYSRLDLPAHPQWLSQVHSNKVVQLKTQACSREADASYTRQENVVCAVLTADCLPLLLCDMSGTTIAAIHAGWRGLADGIISTTIEAMNVDRASILVWLGPAIGPGKFEVGSEVKDIFSIQTYNTDRAFRKISKDKWLADIYQLAKNNLRQLGVSKIYGGDQCTFSRGDKYYSYRRDGVTGRMASLIWKIRAD